MERWTALPVLAAPARYFPLRAPGRYEVSPGLRLLCEADFGNGPADARLFQIDDGWPRFRANKAACRRENWGKYVAYNLTAPVARAVARLFLDRLPADYPALFTREASGVNLFCRLTGERLTFDENLRLADAEAAAGALLPPYRDAFDALCSQVPEDIAVVQTSPERGNKIAALHLCAPSHWSARDKIGKDFSATHAPVPGMEKSRRPPASDALVDAMVFRGPWVRFAWGLSANDRLNHHPDPPPGWDLAAWRDPIFDPKADPPFFFRVERQVLWGLPDVGAAVFAIRVYHHAATDLAPGERARLREALVGMDEASRAYKGLAGGRAEQIIAWLAGKEKDTLSAKMPP